MAARRKKNIMTRAYRVFLNDLNEGKSFELKRFLRLCRQVMQYFVDLHWQRQDFSAKLASLSTVHRAVKRFGITTRLSQALCKQAKEFVASQRKKNTKRKPRLRQHVVTLFYHFVTIEPFNGSGFDWRVKFIGSGAPKLICPIPSTKLLNEKLATGWIRSKTIRLGLRSRRLFVDLLVEKERPQLRSEGKVVGMDSNYKNGMVFSDGQNVAQKLHTAIQSFAKRQKHTRAEIKSQLGKAVKQIDFSQVKMLVIEDLKKVKHGLRGTFSRMFNRRLSHWLYAYVVSLLERKCEELGIQLERKDPRYTSQFCSHCNKWDRRNRKRDRFCCVHCGYLTHADHNAAHNLELLGMAGVYGLRSYLKSEFCLKNQSFE